MAQYTYLVADALTGAIRDEIPFSSVSFSRSLSKAGGFSGTVSIDPDVPQSISGLALPPRVTLANLQAGRTFLWVIRDSQPVWGGFLWAHSANLQARTVQLAGQDFFSYYARRTINATKTYTVGADDQFSIVAALIAYAAAQSGGDIGTTVTYTALSGRKRDRVYYSYEHRQIAEAISQLASVDDGFDFAIDYGGTQATGFTHTLTLSYPKRGRTTNLVFDARKNVRLLAWDQDGAGMANKVWALGAGEEYAMTQASATDTSKLASYPLLEEVVSYKDVTVQQTIIDHATQDLRIRREPVETVSVEVNPNDIDSALGSFIVGDAVRVIANDGFVDLDQFMRIMDYTVSVDENAAETVKIDLASLEGTS